MLMIEALRRILTEVRRLPLVTVAGLGLMAITAVLDVAVHVTLGHEAHHSGLAGLAHLGGIVGMFLVLAGVVTFGARRQLRRSPAAHTGGSSDAHR
jgi:hypothetical protein